MTDDAIWECKKKEIIQRERDAQARLDAHRKYRSEPTEVEWTTYGIFVTCVAILFIIVKMSHDACQSTSGSIDDGLIFAMVMIIVLSMGIQLKMES